MAQGQNAAQQRNGNRDYWSARPFSLGGSGKVVKVLCHRRERRIADRDTAKLVAANDE